MEGDQVAAGHHAGPPRVAAQHEPEEDEQGAVLRPRLHQVQPRPQVGHGHSRLMGGACVLLVAFWRVVFTVGRINFMVFIVIQSVLPTAKQAGLWIANVNSWILVMIWDIAPSGHTTGANAALILTLCTAGLKVRNHYVKKTSIFKSAVYSMIFLFFELTQPLTVWKFCVCKTFCMGGHTIKFPGIWPFRLTMEALVHNVLLLVPFSWILRLLVRFASPNISFLKADPVKQ